VLFKGADVKKTDKFLMVIVIGIVLLVAVAFGVALLRPEPTYQSEDTPDGIAHNYLLALQKEDYTRAYGYLSPSLKHYPATVNDFLRDIERDEWMFRVNENASLAVVDVKITGDRAVVAVRETRFFGRELFSSGQSMGNFDMKLELENGAWKIVQSEYYFAWCWTGEDKCK